MKNLYVFLLGFSLLLIQPSIYSQTTLLYDNFEQFEVGTSIESTGWMQLHSGAGDHKIIADNDNNRNKVLQINGLPGWAGEFYKDVTYDGIFTVECYVKVAYNSGFNASLSLLNTNNQWAGRVSLDNNTIWAVEGNDYNSKKVLAQAVYVVGEWLHIKMVVNNHTQKFSVYINNELKASEGQTLFSLHQPVSRVLLTGGHNGMDTRFDEVKVEYSRLIAHYPFNGNANDVTASANHGTVYGATFTTDRYGNENSAIRFNGTTDYIACNTAVGPFNNQSRTITFWAKTDKEPSGQQQNTVVSYGGYVFGAGNRFEIGLNTQCRGIGFDGSSGYLTRSFNNSDNEWHFYAVVINSETGSTFNDIKFYADGHLLTSTCNDYNSNLSINTQMDFALHMGRLYDNSHTRFFKGDLDDLRIYSDALDSEDIVSIFEKGYTTATRPFQEKERALVWPNPTYGMVYISGITDINASTVEVFNSYGQKIETINLKGGNSDQLDLTPYANGMYILRIISSTDSATYKILKIK